MLVGLHIADKNRFDITLQAGPASGGFRGYIVPGPGPKGARFGRVQVSALSFGIAP